MLKDKTTDHNSVPFGTKCSFHPDIYLRYGWKCKECSKISIKELEKKERIRDIVNTVTIIIVTFYILKVISCAS